MADKFVPAEIAGVVFSIDVVVGAQVVPDQTLCVLESMKMHIPLEAPSAGTVLEIFVTAGDTVSEGQDLFKLAV